MIGSGRATDALVATAVDAGFPPEAVIRLSSCDDPRVRELAAACVLLHLDSADAPLDDVERLLEVAPHASIVVVTEREEDERAILALQRGAHEALTHEGCTPATLRRIVRAAVERARAAMEHAATDALTSESEALARAILDSLDTMALAVDTDGTIFRSNEAWRRQRPFAGAGTRCDVGANYFAVCEEIGRDAAPDLLELARGVRWVLARSASRFERDCHLPWTTDGRRLRLIALPLLGHPGAVLSHSWIGDEAHVSPDGDAAAASRAGVRPLPGGAPPSSTGEQEVDVAGAHATRDARGSVLEAEIGRALAAGEFSLALHPIVSAGTGRVIAAEALLRWQRLGGHWVSPADLIPAVERAALIRPVGHWVIDAACAALSVLERHFGGERRLGISINLSGAELADPELPDDVSGALAAHGCDPRLVCLEVTETAVAEDLVGAADNLERLRRLGLSIALDDFGTGYASLQYAKHFRVNIVKIDKCFIDEIVRGGPDQAIVASVVSLAHGLGARVIAEGVENMEQLKLLAALDCDALQGFLFSRPLTVEAFVALCERERQWWDAPPA